MRFHIAPHNIGFADQAPQQKSTIPGARLTVKYRNRGFARRDDFMTTAARDACVKICYAELCVAVRMRGEAHLRLRRFAFRGTRVSFAPAFPFAWP
jgi:hypothetical protein